jgi:hypothetical protein
MQQVSYNYEKSYAQNHMHSIHMTLVGPSVLQRTERNRTVLLEHLWKFSVMCVCVGVLNSVNNMAVD